MKLLWRLLFTAIKIHMTTACMLKFEMLTAPLSFLSRVLRAVHIYVRRTSILLIH
jgi:hypothetical protein